jgi:type IV pilus assembly protein PilX
MHDTNRYRIRSQQGAVLIVALVLLLVLTVLGTAGIQDTTMEERMAGNFRDHSAALQAAETALRTGEVELGSSTAFGSMTFTSGGSPLYDVAAMTHGVDPTSVNWSNATEARVVNATILDKANTLLNADPNYYIEQLPEIELPASDLTVGFQNTTPRVQYYRITGRGSGISPTSEVIVQSTYFR